MSDRALVILCTAPDDAVGARLAKGLVEAKLAACVNLIPAVRSFYTWDGAVHDESEVQLVVKTRASRYDAVAAWIAANHPYDVPEIIALEVARGSKSYLGWLLEQTEET